jgi:hypothetical protein
MVCAPRNDIELAQSHKADAMLVGDSNELMTYVCLAKANPLPQT